MPTLSVIPAERRTRGSIVRSTVDPTGQARRSTRQRGVPWPGFVLAWLITFSLSFSPFADLASAAVVDAPPAVDMIERTSDLQVLRGEIESLRKEMAATEGARRHAIDDLQESERAISTAQRELQQLKNRSAAVKATLNELMTQSTALQQRLHAQQAQLEKILRQQYLHGKPDPLRLFLNGDDANQLTRDLYYLATIGRSRGQLLQSIADSLQQQRRLTDETRQRAEQLTSLESAQSAKYAHLEEQRQQRQATLAKISGQLASQRQAIGDLQRDEKRLTTLIDHLSKIIASRAAEAREAARRQEQQRINEQRESARRDARRRPMEDQQNRQKADPSSVETIPTETATGSSASALPPDKPVAATATPPAEGGLSRLKGQLHSPVRGAVTNRFGATRQEGSPWRGLFIRAGSGSEVRSIAGGRVVFAEWMRGFGNLLIVDHGSSYLSVYANNDSLLKQVGDEVRGGETVATVGNSGGNPESGLYFELRHQGKPVDPSSWLPLK